MKLRLQFQLRDVLWIFVVCAVLAAWWADRQQLLKSEAEAYVREKAARQAELDAQTKMYDLLQKAQNEIRLLEQQIERDRRNIPD